MSLVTLIIVSQVTPVAHPLDVFRDVARWVTMAWAVITVQVRHREHDCPLGPFRRFTIAFRAAPWAGVGAVETALAHTFTPSTGSNKTNPVGEIGPVLGVLFRVEAHRPVSAMKSSRHLPCAICSGVYRSTRQPSTVARLYFSRSRM